MADIFSPSSIDPGSRGNLPGTVRFVLDKYLAGVDDMLPARVISYNRTTNRAKVQPLINVVTTNLLRVPRAQIASVPVMQIGGGGFVVSFPLNPGDLGWIKANDRDLSAFLQTFNSSDPATQRKHTFEDAVFIPDTMLNGVTIAAEDKTNKNLVIQNYAGTVKIAWWATFLKIIAPRVGIGGTPDDNAIVDIQSKTKAFLMPRMTTAERNAIPNPHEGFLIWNTDTHGINGYNEATHTWS